MEKQKLAIIISIHQRNKKKRMARRNRYLLRTYGITLKDYDQMVLAQNGCAICGRKYKYKNYQIDHDHKTGRIRGLLCRRCNTSLGTLGDTIESIEKVLQYLKA